MQNLYIKIPDGANVVIDKLYENGHSAFVVGGCVRDFILEKEPHDWDICTDALPEQVMQIFGEKNVIPTGIKHGTVTVLIGNDNYEVTTYRIDGMYSDGRRPDNVEFTQNLIEDLSRRDFSINAMAYNDKIGLIDPFDGISDIKNRRICCVGDPGKRFGEDYLRILRAIRFSSTFGFIIDKHTRMVAAINAPNLRIHPIKNSRFLFAVPVRAVLTHICFAMPHIICLALRNAMVKVRLALSTITVR